MKLLLIALICVTVCLAQDVDFDCSNTDWSSLFDKCKAVIARISNATRPAVDNDRVNDLPTRSANDMAFSGRDTTKRSLADFEISNGRIDGVCDALSECAVAYRKYSRVIAFCANDSRVATAIRGSNTALVRTYTIRRILDFLREQCSPEPEDRRCRPAMLERFKDLADTVVHNCFMKDNILNGVCSERCDFALRALANIARFCIHRPAVLETMRRLKPLVIRRKMICDRIENCGELRQRLAVLYERCTAAVEGGECSPACRLLRIAGRRYINYCTRNNAGDTSNELTDDDREKLIKIDESCNFVRRGDVDVVEENDGRIIRATVTRPIDFPGETIAECISEVKDNDNKAPFLRCLFGACKDNVQTTLEMVIDRVSECLEANIDDPDSCFETRDMVDNGDGDDSTDLGRGSVDADSTTGNDGDGAEVSTVVQSMSFLDGCRMLFRQKAAATDAVDTVADTPVGAGIESVMTLAQCVRKNNKTKRVVSLHLRCSGDFGPLEDDPDQSDFKRITCGCGGIFRAKKTATCTTWDGEVKEVTVVLKIITKINAKVTERQPKGAAMKQIRVLGQVIGGEDCETFEWDPSVTVNESTLDSSVDQNPGTTTTTQPPSDTTEPSSSDSMSLFIGLGLLLSALLLSL